MQKLPHYEQTDLINGVYKLMDDMWIFVSSIKKPEELRDEDYSIISIIDSEVKINNLSLQYQLFILDDL